MLNRRTLLVATAAALPFAARAQASSWPNKPVRVVVPYGAGGGADNFARPLAQHLSQQLGQQFIIDNRGGASGMIGSGVVASAPADGYTLLINFSSLYLAPLFVDKPPYDPVKDFTPITLAATTPQVIVVHPSLPVKDMKELIDYARKNPGKVNYVTAGAGTQQHLTGETLAATTKTRITHVAYKGGNQAMTDLLGGQVQMGILVLSTVLPQIQAGKLRALAVIDAQRSKLFPQFPTVAESGLPGFSMPETFISVVGPAGMPAPLVARINGEVQKALHAAPVRTALEGAGYEAVTVTPEDYAAKARNVYAMFQRIVKENGATEKSEGTR
jgi:tripartite-type tricarboxylate transporter receptor subunit TctC